MVEDAVDETRGAIKEAFIADTSAQEQMRQFFTTNPPSLREAKETDEFRNSGLMKKEGVIINISTQQPASFEEAKFALDVVDERMLTEANPQMRELGFEYLGQKITPMSEASR